MAALGPQTTTFTETVNAGASGTLTTINWTKAENTTVGADPELFYTDNTNNNGTIVAAAYAQKSGQKCLLQLDIVENDTAESIGSSDTSSTTGFQNKIKELPELVRRAAASQAHIVANSTNNTGKAVIKSVYVRVEYANHALSTN